MAAQPLVAVRGEIVLEVAPEVAGLTVTVTARDSDRTEVLKLLNKGGAAVQAILAGFGDAAEKVETSAVSVSPQTSAPTWPAPKKPKPVRVIGYLGVLRHTVTVAAFDRLGELFARLAGEDMVEVAGPWWALRDDSPVYRRARVLAAQDAVRRGREYAQAVGSELADLVELADTRLLSEPGPTQFMVGAPMMRGMAVHDEGAPEELTFDLEPAKQTVRATVEARFTITPPDLSGVGAGAAS